LKPRPFKAPVADSGVFPQAVKRWPDTNRLFLQSAKKGGTMKTKIAMLVLLGSIVVVPVAQAQIKHIEMRVEGMT
jgi:hypothetical protein